VIDIWGIVIIVTGLKRLLRVPIWLAVLLTVVSIAVSMPLAVMFMRSPI
jgi:hypothetical protein